MIPAHRKERSNIIAVIASMAIMTIVYSLSFPLFSAVLHRQGFAHELIGFTAAAQSLGALIIAPVSPYIIRKFGLRSVMLVCIGVLISLIIVLESRTSLPAWLGLRLMLGMCGALMWIAGEAWINHLADDETRGRFIAFYTMALGAGFALGPVALSVFGTDGYVPYVLCVTIMIGAAIPLILIRHARANLSRKPEMNLMRTIRRAPLPMFTNLVFSMATSMLMTFFVLYAAGIGLTEARALYVLSAMAVGGVAIQPLVGYLADKFDRSLLLNISLGLMLFGTALMPFVLLQPVGSFVYALVYGGLRGSLYSLSLILIGAEFEGTELPSASACSNLLWSVGNIVGPFAGGYAMLVWSGHGMPVLVTGLVACLLLIAAVLRARQVSTERH